MKKLLLYTFIAAFTFLAACRKSDNPKIPELARVPIPSLTKDATGASAIIVSDLANFVGKVNVALFFPDDAPPKKMDLVIIKNGDNTNVKVLKADISTFPTLVTFTGPELVSLFGSVKTCDYFDVGVNITSNNGVVYEAFPTTGIAYGSGVTNQNGGIKTALTYSTKVEYDPEIYKGTFTVVSDGFGDFTPGDDVEITQISPTQFSFLQPAVNSPLPIIVTVNPSNLVISIAKQKIGNFFNWEPGYTNPNVSTIASNPKNKVSPCDKTLTVSLNYTVDQGSFGEYVLVLMKK